MFLVSRNRITLVALAALCGTVCILGAGPAQAQTIGSTTIDRPNRDTSTGQVYIYAGGTFAAGESLTTFSWFGNSFSTGVMTPILFERTGADVFTVRGVGTGQSVTSATSVQSFDFGLQYGIDTTTNSNYTFGFINALVNSSGQQTANSAGTVDMVLDTVVPGTGVSGAGSTNRWVFTPTASGINIALGTSFGTSGSGANYNLNNPANGNTLKDRTYSATQTTTTRVPEPGTLVLLTLGVTATGRVLRRNRKRSG